MKTIPATRRSKRKKCPRLRGSALVIAMIVLAFLIPIVTLVVDQTNSLARNYKRGRDFTASNAGADAALELAYAQWRKWINANGGRLPTVADCAGTATADVNVAPALATNVFSAHPAFANLTVDALSIVPVDAADIPVSGSLTATQQKAAMRRLQRSQALKERVARAYSYKASATVTYKPGGTSDSRKWTTSKMVRYFEKEDVSIWQAMMWFEGDLELFPTPDMILGGWVHTNKNLYMGHATNSYELYVPQDITLTGDTNTLSVATGSVKKGDSKGGTNYSFLLPGLVYGVPNLVQKYENFWSNWKVPIYQGSGYTNQVRNVEQLSPLSQSRDEVINTSDNATNKNNDSLREIIEPPVDASGNRTSPSNDDPNFKDRRFYNVADVRIIVDRSLTDGNRVKVYDINGNRITSGAGLSDIYQAVGLSTTGTGTPKTYDFYDYRESNTASGTAGPDSRKVTITEVDVSKLTTGLNAYTSYANGVVYFRDETPVTGTTRARKAARLSKGGTLPTIGMSFVTDQGVYVMGDYNTGTTYNSTTGAIATQPTSSTNTASPTLNTVGSYEPKPSAILADAVTFLSNAWYDRYRQGGTVESAYYVGTLTTANRAASTTTYNTAFLTGYVPSDTTAGATTGNRSGGGINFPRVIEDWNGDGLVYHGSMVQLFDSTMFNTAWRPDIYGAPIRSWYFQTRYLDSPPPGPLEITNYSRGRFVRGS